MADALSRKPYVNRLTAGELPEDLCKAFKDLRLEVVPEGFLAALEVQPLLVDKIKEAQKEDRVMEKSRTTLVKEKPKVSERMKMVPFGIKTVFVSLKMMTSEN